MSSRDMGADKNDGFSANDLSLLHHDNIERRKIDLELILMLDGCVLETTSSGGESNFFRHSYLDLLGIFQYYLK